eukprot:311382-Amphidinium_carterae.1
MDYHLLGQHLSVCKAVRVEHDLPGEKYSPPVLQHAILSALWNLRRLHVDENSKNRVTTIPKKLKHVIRSTAGGARFAPSWGCC